MLHTSTNLEKDSVDESTSDCDDDHCDGPMGEELPCFDYFEPTREYELGSSVSGPVDSREGE